MTYNAPGNADELSADLKREWNNMINDHYRALEARWGSRFFTINPDTLEDPSPDSAIWFGQPAEPAFCLGRDVAIELSDWGITGRHRTHNEYCEYRIVMGKDENDKSRPKRIEVTTELAEYWTLIAMHDPERLRDMAVGILQREVSWEELYGSGVLSPQALDPRERRLRFAREVAGHGHHSDLVGAGIPREPQGKINTETLLFMSHRINGLDDLLYIVMFGAHPWNKLVNNERVKASKEALFRAGNVEHLACRNADPAAATKAHEHVFNGKTVAFADPLGVSIRSFSQNKFFYKDKVVPDNWVRFSRGDGVPGDVGQGNFQRLVFGPSDGEVNDEGKEIFLDDIIVSRGNQDDKVVGGYQVVEQMEVGPKVLAGKTMEITEAEYVAADVEKMAERNDSNSDDGLIVCKEADICESIKKLKAEYDAAQSEIAGGSMARDRAQIR